jgi:hypothetical protein
MASFLVAVGHSITLYSNVSMIAAIIRFVNFPIIPWEILNTLATLARDAPFP